MTMQKKKAKSPYAKYGKTPYVYSDHLNNWTAAIKAGDKAAAEKADGKWKAVYAPECQ